MTSEALALLVAESKHPRGVAAQVESEDLARLLYERARLQSAVKRALESLAWGTVSSGEILELRAALAEAER